MGDLDKMLDDLAAEKRERLRAIQIRRPNSLDARHSGGVELVISTGNNTSTVIDLNDRELVAWAEQMLASAKEIGDQGGNR